MRYNGYLGGEVLSDCKQSIWDLGICSIPLCKAGVGHAPQENFKNTCSEIESEAISECA